MSIEQVVFLKIYLGKNFGINKYFFCKKSFLIKVIAVESSNISFLSRKKKLLENARFPHSNRSRNDPHSDKVEKKML